MWGNGEASTVSQVPGIFRLPWGVLSLQSCRRQYMFRSGSAHPTQQQHSHDSEKERVTERHSVYLTLKSVFADEMKTEKEDFEEKVNKFLRNWHPYSTFYPWFLKDFRHINK